MNKVVTVNLNGRAYEVEEAAYDALRRYLDAAEAKLHDNPDKVEIVSDLEQAIAEKCDLYRTPHKNVIVLADMEAVLREMGDVDVDTESTSEGSAKKDSNPSHMPKRLYRLREGRVFAGVCAGLAAYFNVDVTLIRILFIILTILTHGGFVFGYLLMMFFVPEADTPIQKAQAYGAMLVTANDLIRRARESYDNIRTSPEWQKGTEEMKNEMHKWKHEWKKQQKQSRHQARRAAHAYTYNYAYRSSPMWDAINSLIGMAWFLLILYIGWFLYTHVPGAHEAMNAVGVWIGHLFREAGTYISSRIH